MIARSLKRFFGAEKYLRREKFAILLEASGQNGFGRRVRFRTPLPTQGRDYNRTRGRWRLTQLISLRIMKVKALTGRFQSSQLRDAMVTGRILRITIS
jgi:hypothetical protein